MKKAVVMLCVFAVICMGFAGCGKRDSSGDEATILSRAQHLSEYYKNVPGSFNALLGKPESESEDEKSGNKPMSAQPLSVNSEDLFVPDKRPSPTSPGITGDGVYYNNNSVESMLASAKAFANQARDYFQGWTKRLNIWVGAADQRATRLSYNKQFDYITEESFDIDNGGADGNRLNYRKSKLFLGKNHKINFSFTAYSYELATQRLSSGYFYEYVEDEYYYYVYNNLSTGVMNKVIYIDLTTTPKRVVSAESFYSESMVGVLNTKGINLELEDGKKVSYITGRGIEGAYLFGSDGNFMLSRNDNKVNGDEVYVDLWQLDGWDSLVRSGDSGYRLTTTNGDSYLSTIENNSVIYEDANTRLRLSVLRPDATAPKGNILAKVVIKSTDTDITKYSNVESLLTNIGLSFKDDLSAVYESYYAGSYGELIEGYVFGKIDYAALDSQRLNAILTTATADGAEFMKGLLAEISGGGVYSEYDEAARSDKNEAYAMLDSSLTGEAVVSYGDLSVDFSGLKVTVPDSVLHIKGNKYGVKIGWYNGLSFVPLASSETVYNNAEMVIAFSGSVSLIADIEAETEYTLVAYVCNEAGDRYSEFVFPDISADGTGKKEIDNSTEKSTVTVCGKNKALTIKKQ